MRINGHTVCFYGVEVYMKKKGLVMALSRVVDGFQVFIFFMLILYWYAQLIGFTASIFIQKIQ